MTTVAFLWRGSGNVGRQDVVLHRVPVAVPPSVEYSLDSVHEVFGVSDFSGSVVKVGVVSHGDDSAFLPQRRETPACDWTGTRKKVSV